MASVNRMKRTWAEGRPAFGLWSAIPDSFTIEQIAGADLDYVLVDQQHGVIDYASMVSMVRTAQHFGATPVVRVPQNEPWMIMRALDAGALGVVVPLVNDAAEAARAVAACRFPPQGSRSYGPNRASGVIGSKAPADLADEVLCMVQIETQEGLKNAEEIAATPGLDGVYIGPADLALSLGLELGSAGEEREHVEALGRIREACRENGIAVGTHVTSGRSAREHAEQGYTMLNVGVDYLLLANAIHREVGEARGRKD